MSRDRLAVESVIDYGTRDAWLKARLSGVGASESAALFDMSPWTNRYALWLEKTSQGAASSFGEEEEERLLWGHILEQPIIDQYEKRSARKLWRFGDYCIARHPEMSELIATPDAFIVESNDRPGDGLAEVKNTANLYTPDGWRDGVPLHVQCQVQHQLAVTGRDFAVVLVLINGCRLMSFEVERDEGFIAVLLEEVSLFWRDVVEKRRPPVDGSKATMRALKALHPLDNGQTVELSADVAGHWDVVLAAKERIATIEEQERLAHNNIIEAIGPNTFGRLPDGRTLSYRAITRGAYRPGPVAACTYRVLREMAAGKAAALASTKKKGKAA